MSGPRLLPRPLLPLLALLLSALSAPRLPAEPVEAWAAREGLRPCAERPAVSPCAADHVQVRQPVVRPVVVVPASPVPAPATVGGGRPPSVAWFARAGGPRAP